MLNPQISDILNAQVALESASSATYLAMAVWCEIEGLEGCSSFLYRQSDEERMHMLKLIHYITESEGTPKIQSVPEPVQSYDSIQSLFEKVYQQEQAVTAAINEIVALCYEIKDHATLSFMQWYVEEQREEESLMRTIIDKIKLIGDGPQSLYYVDKELRSINLAQLKAEAAE